MNASTVPSLAGCVRPNIWVSLLFERSFALIASRRSARKRLAPEHERGKRFRGGHALPGAPSS